MNAHAVPPLETKSRKPDPEMERAIYRAVEEADITQLPGWDSVLELAPEVYPESMVVYVEGLIVDGDDVTVPADLTLQLVYEDDESGLPTEFQDNYPAQLKFKLVGGPPKLALVSVKIST